MRPRRRRGIGQISSSRRRRRIRRAGADGPRFFHGNAADRRSRKFRIGRRRPRRGDEIHRMSIDAGIERGAVGRLGEGRRRFHTQLRRERGRADGVARASARAVVERMRGHCGGDGDERSSAQPRGIDGRVRRIDACRRGRAGRIVRRRIVPPGPRSGLSDGGANHGHVRIEEIVLDGERRRGRTGRDSRGADRQQGGEAAVGDRRDGVAVSGEQGGAAGADRRYGQREEDRGRGGSEGRERQGRDTGRHRAQEGRRGGGGAEQPLQEDIPPDLLLREFPRPHGIRDNPSALHPPFGPGHLPRLPLQDDTAPLGLPAQEGRRPHSHRRGTPQGPRTCRRRHRDGPIRPGPGLGEGRTHGRHWRRRTRPEPGSGRRRPQAPTGSAHPSQQVQAPRREGHIVSIQGRAGGAPRSRLGRTISHDGRIPRPQGQIRRPPPDADRAGGGGIERDRPREEFTIGHRRDEGGVRQTNAPQDVRIAEEGDEGEEGDVVGRDGRIGLRRGQRGVALLHLQRSRHTPHGDAEGDRVRRPSLRGSHGDEDGEGRAHTVGPARQGRRRRHVSPHAVVLLGGRVRRPRDRAGLDQEDSPRRL
mmetsp:Transcript_30828/g.92359  ORF Transcript_30828/g.92359 Transcript_30828/m.92359 type:complete len:589 (+) Transcript_30828:533-2299(+)